MSLANVYILAAFRALAILLSLARGQRDTDRTSRDSASFAGGKPLGDHLGVGIAPDGASGGSPGGRGHRLIIVALGVG
jgi:hypothetical protein